MSTQARVRVRAASVVLLVSYAALAGAALWSDASVADEHPHILSGWLFWESGRFSGGLDNPPLGQLLVAAPLRLAGLDYRFPDDALLAWARLPVVVLLLLLAALISRWAASLADAMTGVAALGFLVLEPNLVAHGHLATLDLPLTFFWWAALWQWRRVLQHQTDGTTGARTALAGFCVALALASFTKFTGLLLLPVCALVALTGLRTRGARLRACGGLVIATLGLLLVSYVVYGIGALRAGLPAQFVDATAGKWAHRDDGHFAYLMGRRSLSGFPEYYLVTLLVKTPVPLLALALTGAIASWRSVTRLDRALLVVPAALLIVVFSIVGVNIGVRHILPVYPALVLGAAVGARFAWRRRATRIALLVVCAAWALGVARVVPEQLAYFNIVAGGPSGGHRWLLDSNLDWGQDDRRLQRFLRGAAERGEAWEVNPDGARARNGRLVVNANRLHNLLLRDTSAYDWLRTMQASGRAGYAWRRYELQTDDFAARVAKAPHDLVAHVAYAEALAHAGDWEGSQARYHAALPAFADQPRLFRSAVESALQQDDVDAAARWLQRGLEHHRGDVSLQTLAQRVEFERVVRASPSAEDGARAGAMLGLWWAEQGRIELALPWLRQAAEALPEEVEVVRALGVAEARAGRFGAAVTVFERPRVAAALRPEAAACRALARTEAALAGAEMPRPERARWMELATTHFGDGRYDRAAAALVEILRDDAADADALALLCEMHVRAKLRIVDAPVTPRSLRALPPTGENR